MVTPRFFPLSSTHFPLKPSFLTVVDNLKQQDYIIPGKQRQVFFSLCSG